MPDRIPIDGYELLLHSAAIAVHRRFPDHSTIEDLYQDAAEYWLTGLQRHLPDYLQDEEPRRIYTAICRRLHRQCRVEKAKAGGYAPQDQVRYTRDELDRLLPFALGCAKLPELRGQSEENIGGGHVVRLVFSDTLAALADVKTAVGSLSAEDELFLLNAEKLGRNWERLAPEYNMVQPESLARRHARTLDRLVRWLGRDTDVEEYETHALP